MVCPLVYCNTPPNYSDMSSCVSLFFLVRVFHVKIYVLYSSFDLLLLRYFITSGIRAKISRSAVWETFGCAPGQDRAASSSLINICSLVAFVKIKTTVVVREIRSTRSIQFRRRSARHLLRSKSRSPKSTEAESLCPRSICVAVP
jgi:hypothetical protein